MNTIYIDKNSGRVVAIDKKIDFTDGTVYTHVEGEVNPNDVYVKDGEIRFRPSKPTGSCAFDTATEEWKADPTGQWNMVRAERQLLLSRSDWTQMPDVPLTTKQAWATYRQALRDITSQDDPFNIRWPVPPSN